MSIPQSKKGLTGKHKDVGDRLREFGEKEFGSMKAFARELGISVQHLSPYINGKHIPGNKLQAQIEKLGGNVHYLVTGETKDQLEEKLEGMKRRIVSEMFPKEKMEMLKYLDDHGIFSVEELREYIDLRKLDKAKRLKATEPEIANIKQTKK